MKQSRIQSPVLWSAAAGIILMLLRHLGAEAALVQGSALADTVFNLVCALLAMFGVINNPTNKTGL